jgi:hypothetical protein
MTDKTPSTPRISEADTKQRAPIQFGRVTKQTSGDEEDTIRLDDANDRSEQAPGGKPSPPQPSAEQRSWAARDRALAQRQVAPSASSAGAHGERPARSARPGSQGDHPAAVPASTEIEPVVGWLVVIDGPGKGRSMEIKPGQNSIGADPGQRIALMFGDPGIADIRHAFIVFDPKSQRYFLQNGDSVKLTYMGDEVLLSPVEIKGGETFLLGRTTLLFVRLCGDGFSWTA